MKLARISLFVSLILALLVFASAQARAADFSTRPEVALAVTPLPSYTPIPIPALISPAKGATPAVIRPFFDWADMPNVTAYNITISTYSNFAYPLVSKTVSVSKYTPTEDLTRNVRIYWRVQAAKPSTSAWAGSYFTAPNPPYSPAPLSPGLDAIVTNYTPTLDWAASVIPTGTTFAFYELQVDDSSDFSSLLVFQTEPNILKHAYTFSTKLPADTVFYWRVRTANTLGQFSMWRTSSFHTALLPPTLIAPAYLEVPNTLRPLLDWSDVPGATGYGIEVSIYPDFSSKVVTTAVTESRYQPVTDLPRNKVLYWRVRTHGAAISAWSTSSFTSPCPADPVKLLSPIGNSYVGNTPTLDWSAAVVPVGAQFAYYQVQVSKGDFSTLYLDATVNNISQHFYTFTPQNSLDPNNGAWHWRVRVANTANQFSAWAMADFLTYPPTPTRTPTRTPTVTPASQMLNFSNLAYGFTFSYPANATVTQDSNTSANFILPFIPGTSLNGKTMEIHIWTASGTCQSRRFGKTSGVTEMIGGVTYLHETGTEPGAVNFQDWNSYSVVRNGFCINVLLNLVYDNPNFYPTPRPAFDKTAETAVFGQIMNSFHWLPITATPTPLPPAAPLNQLYENLPNGFHFYYPSDASLISDDGIYYARIDLTIIPGTNLSDKYLEARAWDASRPCEKTPAGVESTHRMETINGLSFFIQEGWEGAAGNIYNWISYSTYKDAVCTNMVLVLHSTNPDVYQYPPLQYDKAAESAIIGQIIHTFAWLSVTAVPSSTPTPTLTPTLIPGGF